MVGYLQTVVLELGKSVVGSRAFTFEADQITALAVSPNDSGLIFVADSNARIYVAHTIADRVLSWEIDQTADVPARSFGFDNDGRRVHAVLGATPNSVQASTLYSADSGSSWKWDELSVGHARPRTMRGFQRLTAVNCTPRLNPKSFNLRAAATTLK
jgi:hypothetical protein